MLSPALIGPVFDLLAVRAFTNAIRANLLAAGGTEGPLGTIQNPRPLSVDSPVDRFEPRHAIEPTPRFEPRPVHRPTPRVEAEPVVVRAEVKKSPRVWDELPPVQARPAVVDTCGRLEHVYRPPIAGIGTLIDQFL